MTKITVIQRSNTAEVIECQDQHSVMESIRDAGVDELLALCGGSCSCATCHVYIDENWLKFLPPVSEDENDLLDGSDYRKDNSRLSCQIKVTQDLEGMTVTIAPEE